MERTIDKGMAWAQSRLPATPIQAVMIEGVGKWPCTDFRQTVVWSYGLLAIVALNKVASKLGEFSFADPEEVFGEPELSGNTVIFRYQQ